MPGLKAPAAYTGQPTHELVARQAELGERMGVWGNPEPDRRTLAFRQQSMLSVLRFRDAWDFKKDFRLSRMSASTG
jgi:hypothetical protein